MKKKLTSICLLTLVAALAFCVLAACSEIVGGGANKLDAPANITYDPDTERLSWEYVNGANAYVIRLGEEAEREVHGNGISYKPEGEEFTFSIRAKGSEKDDSDTVTVTFVSLPADITFTVDDEGKIGWNTVPGADGYKVLLDGANSLDVISPQYNDIPVGAAHSVRVKPTRGGGAGVEYYAKWSTPVTVNKLGVPESGSIKYADGFISWNAVASASQYKVTVNGVEHSVDTNKYVYDAKGESFAVTVKAIGNHQTTYDGQTSAEKSFVYLAPITNINVENGVLVWDKTDGATEYKIRLYDNSVGTVTANTESYSGLASGSQYNIRIMPTASGENIEYFSDWSLPFPAYILPAPQPRWTAGFDADGTNEVNAINWDAVASAAGYSYRATMPDGTVAENALGANNNYYSSAFSQVGEYKVEIKATGSGASGIFDSKYSTPITVRRLTAPVIENTNIKSVSNNLAAGFTVEFNAVSGASGYTLYRNGTSESVRTSPGFAVSMPVTSDVTGETDISYFVQSTGSISADKRTVILNSMTGAASASSAFSIKVLAAPTAPTMEGYKYSFEGSDKAVGYSIRVSGTNYDSAVEEYDLSMLNAGSFNVSVCAKGNGSNVLASNYSTALNVTRLNAPFDLRISTDESDGVLIYEGDPKAQSYEATITGRNEAFTVDTATNIKEYITTAATVVNMRSIANYFEDVQHTVYYMTSKPSINYTFFKLEAPSNINFSDTAMSWNGPSNLSASAAFTPTYKIFNGANNTIYNGEFSGTSYPLNNLDGGATYSFDIQAIGDGEHYVNSDVSHSREIYKLATPSFSVNVSQARYEWRAVAQAVGYVLSIDGTTVANELHETNGTWTYVPTYATLGTHTVTVYAKGDGGTTTIDSSVYEFVQQVRQLTTPAFAYSYSSDKYSPTAEISVNVTTQSDYAKGYYYVIGGTTHYSDELTYSFIPNTTGKIEIYVYAAGGKFDDDKVYYSDSRAATTAEIILLGYPSADTISLSQDGVIKWKKIDDAVGYRYKLEITLTDGSSLVIENTINSNVASLDLNTVEAEDGSTLDYANVKTVRITLYALGSLEANEPAATSHSTVSSETVVKAWESALH